jgi:hypothetical protein
MILRFGRRHVPVPDCSSVGVSGSVMALRGRVALLVALLASPVPPVEAQGFWQSMFGGGAQPKTAPGVRLSPSAPATSPYRPAYAWPFAAPISPYQPEPRSDDTRPLAQGGTYRTLCVRLCDGFYFPISNAAPGSSLSRDADTCAAGCGTEARLFYHSSPGGDVDSAVDLTGMGYAALPNAYKYRKTLVDGCRCRPQPWSEAERARHRGYAEAPTGAAGTATETASVAEGARSQPGSGEPPMMQSAAPPLSLTDSERALPRPEPVPRQIERPEPVWPFLGAPTRAPRSRYTWPDQRAR